MLNGERRRWRGPQAGGFPICRAGWLMPPLVRMMVEADLERFGTQ